MQLGENSSRCCKPVSTGCRQKKDYSRTVYFKKYHLKRSTDIPMNKGRKFSGTGLSCLKTGINRPLLMLLIFFFFFISEYGFVEAKTLLSSVYCWIMIIDSGKLKYHTQDHLTILHWLHYYPSGWRRGWVLQKWQSRDASWSGWHLNLTLKGS